MSDKSQGTKANTTGKICEQILLPLFKNNDYVVISHKEYENDCQLIRDHVLNKRLRKQAHNYKDLDKLVLTNAPYTSIYEHNGRTEYLIINNPQNRRIRVEVKYQQVGGSVDEKFPYIWLNCVYAYPEKEIIVLVEGNGFKTGAKKWLKQQAEDEWLIHDDRVVKVMSLGEFVEFFNKELA